AMKGGEHGVDLVPGNAEKSRMYRLAAGLEKPAMPIGGKLSADDIESLRLWIEQGAVWEGSAPVIRTRTDPLQDVPIRPEERAYWAFRIPSRPAAPVVAGARNPIDNFILAALEKKGLKRAPEADRITLLRRAYSDLIGLPPTPTEAAEFLNDKSPDAWEKLIDKLLASPHYGERWGRHWLDVARYADSNGFEHDFDRPNAWRYRDYVIRAFNQDKPYSTMLREQIAGDELPNVTPDSLIATGFLRSYAKVGFREKDNPEFRYEYLDDIIATIGRGVLGLTVQCARCHDHKFDPIRQADYYRLQSSLWGYVEVDHPLTSKEVADAWQTKNKEIDSKVADLKAELKTLEGPYRNQLLPAKYKNFPQNIQDALATPEAKRSPGQVLLANQVIRGVSVSDAEIARVITPADEAEKQRLLAAIAQLQKQRPEPIPVAMGVTDGDYRFTPDGPGDEPAPGKGKKREAIEGSYVHTGPGRYQVPPSYFLIRGDVNSHGPETKPGFVKVITYGNPATELPPPTEHTSGRRLALAEWLVSRENPMTARVAVNRIWHHHFGEGIVSTLDNFGKMGEAPTNPELLDWLAVEFVDRGWSMKQMHRLIMTSATYKMASEFQNAATLNANMAKDPQDKLLWRHRMQRLDAESIRDAILTASGGLNRQMEGPPVFPVLPQELLKSVSTGIWKQKGDGPEVWRRSVYIYRKRGLPMPMLDVFDLPNQNIACGARNVTTVPTQALTLMNNDFVLNQARLFAKRLEEAAPGDVTKQVELAYQIALTRVPQPEEKQMALEFLKEHGLGDFTNVMLNLNEFLYMR
ncbi:MAG: hypothetical protein QOJ99_1192, partial [Bryobacterales bacterium]|nr:hypothetical protein [Bryobacterales bacterium]